MADIKTITTPDGSTYNVYDNSALHSVTMNGSTNTAPSFYAPTSVGSSGQVLKSNGSGAPSWTTFSSGTTITVSSTAPASPAQYSQWWQVTG